MNWQQLQTIFWLRWRLMMNQGRRSGGGIGIVLTAAVIVMAIGVAAGSFAGGLLAGIFALGDQPPRVIMIVWLCITLAFLFFWTLGLLTELQRSETIDLQKLMHLPVALGQMFTINYLASHFNFSLVLTIPGMIGLSLGLVPGHGPLMILLVPLAMSMVLMVTAWTYCLRGWLATLMSNPRRRRTVIMCITAAFILLAQGPNLYFNVFRHRPDANSSQTDSERQTANQEHKQTAERSFETFIAAQRFVPPLWVPVGAQALAGGNPLPALLGTLGCAGIAALGLLRAYRTTVRFYRGDTGGKAAAKMATAAEAKKPAARGPGRKGFLEYSIPMLPEQSAALALATFRSLVRAPEVKMAWASSFIVTVIIGGTFFFRTTTNMPEEIKPFIATGAVIFPVFFFAQFFGNQFGFDRDGFRALMLSPADRRLILLGKNVACLPVGLLLGLILIVLTSYRLHLPPATVAATAFQLISVLLIAGMAGNFLSVITPNRIQPGSMKPTKMPGLAMLLLMVCQMLFPTLMLPVLVAPALELIWRRLEWPGFIPVNLLVSSLLAALVAFIYWQSLGPLGRLLQRREAKILAVIAVEVE